MVVSFKAYIWLEQNRKKRQEICTRILDSYINEENIFMTENNEFEVDLEDALKLLQNEKLDGHTALTDLCYSQCTKEFNDID